MMKKERGLTIIQLMMILLVAGIVGSLIVDAIIEKRCESRPGTALCTDSGKAVAPNPAGSAATPAR